MACMRLGSKSESFRREGQTWLCSSGLASDVTIEIEEVSFQLHKFPLISRSGLLEKKIGETSAEIPNATFTCVIKLDDIPGGAKAFELVAKFCYGIKLELTASNVVTLRCAADYLQMTEDYGEGNLIAQTELFLNEVFASWPDSMKALETCEEVLAQAEDAHIVSRCINSLAMKACADPTLFSWPISNSSSADAADSGQNVNEGSLLSPKDTGLWNGISRSTNPRPITEDWWYEDVSFLTLPLYKRLIKAVECRGMKPERVAGSLMFYAKRYLPSINRQCSFKDLAGAAPTPPESDQRNLLEEIEAMLPIQKGVNQTKFLLRLLRSAMVLHANPSCRETLEKRVGAQLDQASLVDLLIPNMGYATETTYDVDCVQRIVDHFMVGQLGISTATSPQIVEAVQVAVDGNKSLAALTNVADLVDAYLAEVAPDVNLKLPKFQALASAIPDYARPKYDGLYHAIDTYLKAHVWLTEAEREQICRLMNCQKLSVEASTHAAQNERLPLRVVVQVLFFEQLRLRTQISGWFFVSDSLEGTRNLQEIDGIEDHGTVGVAEDVRGRVTELEKECMSMRQEIEKLGRVKRRWSIFSRLFQVRKKGPPMGLLDSKLTLHKAIQDSQHVERKGEQDDGKESKGSSLEKSSE